MSEKIELSDRAAEVLARIAVQDAAELSVMLALENASAAVAAIPHKPSEGKIVRNSNSRTVEVENGNAYWQKPPAWTVR
jgi:hypothetical protein